MLIDFIDFFAPEIVDENSQMGFPYQSDIFAVGKLIHWFIEKHQRHRRKNSATTGTGIEGKNTPGKQCAGDVGIPIRQG